MTQSIRPTIHSCYAMTASSETLSGSAQSSAASRSTDLRGGQIARHSNSSKEGALEVRWSAMPTKERPSAIEARSAKNINQ